MFAAGADSDKSHVSWTGSVNSNDGIVTTRTNHTGRMMVLSDPTAIVDFIVLSQRQLAHISGQLRTIQTSGLGADSLQTMVVSLHSIQVSAGFLGLNKIQSVAHELHEIVPFLESGKPHSALVTCILRAVNFLNDLLSVIESSNEADVEPYLECLRHFRRILGQSASLELSPAAGIH